MTHVTCRLTAKNRDQLRNPTLGNRVWASFFVGKVKYIAVRMSVSPCVPLCLCMSVVMPVYVICPSLCLCVCLCLSLCPCMCLCMSVPVHVCLSLYVPVCVSVCLSVCLSLCPCVCLFLCLSVCLYVLVYVCLGEWGWSTSSTRRWYSRSWQWRRILHCTVRRLRRWPGLSLSLSLSVCVCVSVYFLLLCICVCFAGIRGRGDDGAYSIVLSGSYEDDYLTIYYKIILSLS